MESACEKACTESSTNDKYQVVREFSGEKTVEEILIELVKIHAENE